MNIPILVNVIIESNANIPIILQPVFPLEHMIAPNKTPINNNPENKLFLSIYK